MPFSIKLHKYLVLYLFHNDKCSIGLLCHVNTPCCYVLIDNYSLLETEISLSVISAPIGKMHIILSGVLNRQ